MFNNKNRNSSSTCEHCGNETGYMHTCEESLAIEKEKSEKFEKEYKGNGRKRGTLSIDYECYEIGRAHV